jgi:hypothetical protein
MMQEVGGRVADTEQSGTGGVVRRLAVNTPARNPSVQRTEVMVLRFCAQACSLSPRAVGRSLP